MVDGVDVEHLDGSEGICDARPHFEMAPPRQVMGSHIHVKVSPRHEPKAVPAVDAHVAIVREDGV